MFSPLRSKVRIAGTAKQVTAAGGSRWCTQPDADIIGIAARAHADVVKLVQKGLQRR